VIIERLAIVGIGLIGGSLARALKRAVACREIAGWDLDPQAVQAATRLGVIDRGAADLQSAVAGAELIVVAVPLGAIAEVFAALADRIPGGAVVTDVGSVKGTVIDAARQRLGAAFRRFVPGHPVAGTERSGVAASFAELFDGHRVILTPVAETSGDALARVSAMWEAAGATVERLEAALHDELLAATSHLPHLLAYALVDCLAAERHVPDIFRFAAGGFRDFTRIASSSPAMWRDVLLANPDAVLEVLGRFSQRLEALAGAIRAADGRLLMERLAHAKTVRDEFCRRFPALDRPSDPGR
jgi:prephenate dehydrogenase